MSDGEVDSYDAKKAADIFRELNTGIYSRTNSNLDLHVISLKKIC